MSALRVFLLPPACEGRSDGRDTGLLERLNLVYGSLSWIPPGQSRQSTENYGRPSYTPDRPLRRLAALKVMRPDCAAQDEARAHCLRETWAPAARKHGHIATIYRSEKTKACRALAMEFLTGTLLGA